MPPKPMLTREDAAAAALAIIKEGGISALTARELGKRLGTSASPIFTVFRNMDEVKQAARELAFAEFSGFISDYCEYTPAFKRIGVMMVMYGMNQPELFKLLFMQEHKETGFTGTLSDFGELAQVCRELIQRDYELSEEEAAVMLEQMWTHAFGLGAMCAMGVCRLTEEEIGRRLGMAFAGVIMLIRSGKQGEIYSDTENHTNGTYHGQRLGEIPFKP